MAQTGAQPDAIEPAGAPAYRPWLHRAAIGFVLLTFCLIMLGGTVTSKGVGLAVPDWPTTYDYNMFLFPPSMWTGGIFWEHTHRLLGSVVGMASIAIAIALWRTQRERPWLQKLGVGVLLLCIVQGVMGGLRVTELSIGYAILHGITAQVFFCMVVLIAAATSKVWVTREPGQTDTQTSAPTAGSSPRGAHAFAIALLLVLLVQLALGAAMRHTGSGFAIEDFPTAYGGLVPPFDADEIHNRRLELAGHNPDIWTGDHTPAQVAIHFAHRVWAIGVVIAVAATVMRLSSLWIDKPVLRGPMVAVGALLVVQIMLGASVIWSHKHPEVATAHQAVGAIILANAALLTMRLYRFVPRIQRQHESARQTSNDHVRQGTLRSAGVQA